MCHGICAVVHNGMAFQNILQAVGHLTVGILACSRNHRTNRTNFVASLLVVGTNIISEPQLHREGTAYEVELDCTRRTALHTGWVIVIKERCIGRQQEREAALHGLEVSIVVQVHVVVINGRLHDFTYITYKRGRSNRAVVGRHTSPVQHINGTVAGKQGGVEINVTCHINILEQRLHSIIRKLAPLAGDRVHKRTLHEVVDQLIERTDRNSVYLTEECIVVTFCWGNPVNGFRGTLLRIIDLQKALASTFGEVVPHLLVAGNEDGGHVLADIHLIIVSIPSRVELESRDTVRIRVVLIRIIRCIFTEGGRLELGNLTTLLCPHITSLYRKVIIGEIPLGKD